MYINYNTHNAFCENLQTTLKMSYINTNHLIQAHIEYVVTTTPFISCLWHVVDNNNVHLLYTLIINMHLRSSKKNTKKYEKKHKSDVYNNCILLLSTTCDRQDINVLVVDYCLASAITFVWTFLGQVWRGNE